MNVLAVKAHGLETPARARTGWLEAAKPPSGTGTKRSHAPVEVMPHESLIRKHCRSTHLVWIRATDSPADLPPAIERGGLVPNLGMSFRRIIIA